MIILFRDTSTNYWLKDTTVDCGKNFELNKTNNDYNNKISKSDEESYEESYEESDEDSDEDSDEEYNEEPNEEYNEEPNKELNKESNVESDVKSNEELNDEIRKLAIKYNYFPDALEYTEDENYSGPNYKKRCYAYLSKCQKIDSINNANANNNQNGNLHHRRYNGGWGIHNL